MINRYTFTSQLGVTATVETRPSRTDLEYLLSIHIPSSYALDHACPAGAVYTTVIDEPLVLSVQTDTGLVFKLGITKAVLENMLNNGWSVSYCHRVCEDAAITTSMVVEESNQTRLTDIYVGKAQGFNATVAVAVLPDLSLTMGFRFDAAPARRNTRPRYELFGWHNDKEVLLMWGDLQESDGNLIANVVAKSTLLDNVVLTRVVMSCDENNLHDRGVDFKLIASQEVKVGMPIEEVATSTEMTKEEIVDEILRLTELLKTKLAKGE